MAPQEASGELASFQVKEITAALLAAEPVSAQAAAAALVVWARLVERSSQTRAALVA
jgi:hypothetical protein